ncbi:MAG: hypothetical protein ACFNJP_07525, partial [Capnocytophaga gingivalis]
AGLLRGGLVRRDAVVGGGDGLVGAEELDLVRLQRVLQVLLAQQNKEKGYDFVSIADVHIEPMGIYTSMMVQ